MNLRTFKDLAQELIMEGLHSSPEAFLETCWRTHTGVFDDETFWRTVHERHEKMVSIFQKMRDSHCDSHCGSCCCDSHCNGMTGAAYDAFMAIATQILDDVLTVCCECEFAAGLVPIEWLNVDESWLRKGAVPKVKIDAIVTEIRATF